MPTWRCPHCGTPQTETARCWVCRRSSTACGTCRHFRRSVAGQLGYCGLDRRRAPLVGDEIRACWESMPLSVVVPSPVAVTQVPARTGAADRPGRRDFIEVDAAAATTVAAAARGASATGPGHDPTEAGAEPPAAAVAPPAEPGWNLWGDLEA